MPVPSSRMFACVALSAALCGCAAAPLGTGVAATAPARVHAEAPREAPASEAVPPPALVVGALERATRGVLATDLVRMPGTAAVYEIVGARNARNAERIVERMELREPARPAPAGDAAAPAALVRIEERGGRVVERMEFTQRADGAIDLVQVDSIADRSRSTFASPLPFAADVASDAVLAGESAMAVRTLPKLAKRAEGTARRTLRVAGECTVSVRGESMRATVVDVEFDVDLDAAKARVRSRQFVVPGRGVVAEIRSESRDVLAVFRTKTDETAVLVRVEEVAAPDGATTPR